jgi:DNA mismatch repair protein MutS2
VPGDPRALAHESWTHSLRVLEFSDVLHHLAAQAASILGRQRAAALAPSPDPDLVGRRLAETREGCDLFRHGPVPSLERATDIQGLLERASIPGARLGPRELLAIADTLETALQLRQHVRSAPLPLPVLTRIASGLTGPAELPGEIRRCIASDGSVAESASPALSRLRADARRTRETVRGTLHELLQAAQLCPSSRSRSSRCNDRYVIPVTPGYRAHLQGIVQDQSASGQTIFLEPVSVVELNNAIRRLEREAEAEVDRLLGELTSRVGEAGAAIGSTLEALADLDLILAKARLAERWHGQPPRILQEGPLRLARVRHPLLLEKCRERAGQAGQEEVVPIDVSVGPDARVLVITGPNTGGKTVALKTVGLAALMTQAGIFTPASPDSQLPVYDSIFADIGDEQSIAQDLSTFSAHVSRLRTILAQAGGNSLVLVDEIGAGTDPGRGGGPGERDS